MRNFYKDLKPAIIVVVVVSIIIIVIQTIVRGRLDLNDLPETILYNIYYGFPLSLINGWLFDFLSKKIPWDKNAKKRALAGVIGSIVITMSMLLLLNLILWVGIRGRDFNILWGNENRTFYIVAMIITFIVTVTLHAIAFFNEVQKEKKTNQKLRQEKLATELSALRAHVDPHFLFNSFNVLSGLIDENTEKAQDFLTGLSKIYRYILEQRNHDTRTVKEELEFAERYLNLQKMRFENSIFLTTKISEEALNKRIPSLSLQLLLENAIKHNGFQDTNPLKIEIYEEEGELVVRNNTQARKNIQKGSGMGLQNIDDRYALLTEKRMSYNKTEDFFTVNLPLI